MCTVVPRVPHFRLFHSTINRLQDITHFRIATLTPIFPGCIYAIYFYLKMLNMTLSLCRCHSVPLSAIR